MSLIIGLTGSIATGKSTVSEMFTHFHIPVIDADQIARLVVEPGQEAYRQIIDYFGNEIAYEDGTINRPELGKIIFADSAKREQLNSIVHPAVRKEMLRQKTELVTKGESVVVLDIPLLFESKLTHYVDKIIVVYAKKEIQLSRLMKRNNYSKKEASQRIQSQMSVDEKTTLADATINNSGSKMESLKQLETILSNWGALR